MEVALRKAACRVYAMQVLFVFVPISFLSLILQLFTKCIIHSGAFLALTDSHSAPLPARHSVVAGLLAGPCPGSFVRSR